MEPGPPVTINNKSMLLSSSFVFSIKNNKMSTKKKLTRVVDVG
jgi:hypothetical protein